MGYAGHIFMVLILLKLAKINVTLCSKMEAVSAYVANRTMSTLHS